MHKYMIAVFLSSRGHEHSAIFNAWKVRIPIPVRSVLFTASGAFLDVPESELENATVEQAAGHPVWSMGKKVTNRSATIDQ